MLSGLVPFIIYCYFTGLLGAYFWHNHIYFNPSTIVQFVDLCGDLLTGFLIEFTIIACLFAIYFMGKGLIEFLQDSGVIEIKK
jgi:hypothetical protein